MLSVCPVVEVDIGSSFNPAPSVQKRHWYDRKRLRNDVVMGEWSLLFPLVRLVSLQIIAMSLSSKKSARVIEGQVTEVIFCGWWLSCASVWQNSWQK